MEQWNRSMGMLEVVVMQRGPKQLTKMIMVNGESQLTSKNKFTQNQVNPKLKVILTQVHIPGIEVSNLDFC